MRRILAHDDSSYSIATVTPSTIGHLTSILVIFTEYSFGVVEDGTVG
jgi:hypothetical protein